MGWVKARFRQARGRMKEADGIVLGNERLRAEGRREQQRSREAYLARHGAGHR
ncbi:hypothetical protein [Streptomyces longisporoflavus]|uniref:CsbD family protein n=1 Tax=Streptomyces longisporoflavus TaxID=28044 RepID=A0ABW7QJ72_9ACTN